MKEGGIVNPSWVPEWEIVDGVTICVNANPTERVFSKDELEGIAAQLLTEPFPKDAQIIHENDIRKIFGL